MKSSHQNADLSGRSLLNINSYHYKRGGSDAVYFDHAALMGGAGMDTAFFAMQSEHNDPTPWSRYFPSEIEMGNKYTVFQKLAIAKKIIYSQEAYDHLDRLLRENPMDIAHIHSIYHHLSPSVIKCLNDHDVPVVLTAHELKILCPAYRMHDGHQVCEKCKPNAVYNCALNRCIHGSLALSALVSVESAFHRFKGYYRDGLATVICPSKFYRQKYLEWGWPEDKVVYIPNACDIDVVDTPPKPGKAFCYFGRLSFEKGVDTFIRASAAAGTPAVIVGVGPDMEKLQALAQELNADVSFLGWRSGEDLFSVIRESRACVLPSEWYENAPISVLEACGRGKIYLGADIGGISEMVDHGRTGYLFRSGDVAHLAETLRLVAGLDDERIQEMGMASAVKTQATYSSKRYVSEMSGLYERLLDGRAKRRTAA